MFRRTFLKLAAGALALPLAARASEPVRLTIPPAPRGFDRERLLRCISQVESGGDDSKVGPKGERSKYQIAYPVWLQHAKPPVAGQRWFAAWCSGLVADAIARDHLDWIVGCVGANPVAVVASWHLGVVGSRRPWTRSAADHIARTVRLYREGA